MITAVLIDDEKASNSVLSGLLNNFTSTPVKILGQATNLDEGIKLIHSCKPDVVFLDIKMPNSDGFELFNHFPEPEFKVIIVSAYNTFGIEALKNSAIDYLLKPVSFLDLQESLMRVSKTIEAERSKLQEDEKLSVLYTPEIEGVNLVFDIESGFIILNSRVIEYCYADQSYSVIVTNTGKETIISKPLKTLQEMLPDNYFYRTHKSYLVNIFYIKRFVRAHESFVYLKSGVKIPVSVRNTVKISGEIRKMLSTAK